MEYKIINDYKKLSFNFDFREEFIFFNVKIGDERLNGIEIKELLKLNEKKGFLNKDGQTVLNYVIHRVSETQAFYKVLTDFDLFFVHLVDSSIPIYYKGIKVKIAKDDLKLNIGLSVDDDGTVLFSVFESGEFIFGLDKAFFKIDNVIYKLYDDVPKDFYERISSRFLNVSVDEFFEMEKSLIKALKKGHEVELSKEVKDLASLKLKSKVAPLVLDVDKTNHFIVVELKYKIGEERYRVEDYKYADTINWMDKGELIKIVKEDGQLVQYVSDLNLSEDIFEKIFADSRITFRKHMKAPFRIMLPMFQLNNFVNKAIPNAEKILEVDYKGGQKIELRRDLVSFDVDVNLNSKIDLLEFKVRFKIGDDYFDLDFIKELMVKSRKYVQLKDGGTVEVENIRDLNKWIEFLKMFSFTRNNGLYKSTTATALELDKFLETFAKTTIKSNEDYKNLIRELKDKKPIEEIKLPSHIDKTLRDYQKEGVYWMHFLKKYGFGGILADEMGLGKTVQALTLLAMEDEGTSIVICPKTLIYNWENEIQKFFPEKKILVIDGDNDRRKKLISECADYDIVVTSYSMLQKDYEEYIVVDFEFNYSILDEAHFVKNLKTLSAKAVRLIKSKNTILLTGTPLENNLSELYAAFDLIMPGFLGTKSDFSKDFVSKIERNNMIALEILQAKIRPFILRRTKAEVLKELPAKQERVVYSEMTNRQVAMYNELLNRVKQETFDLVKNHGFDKSRIQILSALLKLRQICNHPALLDPSWLGEEDLSGKFNQFLELLMQVVDSGSKVLVFSQFTSMLDIFETELKDMGIRFLRLDGSTKNRQEVVNEFNDNDEVKVFLISLKAGGVGLNLTAASSVFLYDPWWNPMVEQQAKDRAHRIGQKKVVTVYKFITKNSIEEKILKLQERKGNMFDNLVTEDNGFIKRLEWEDLMELFD